MRAGRRLSARQVVGLVAACALMVLATACGQAGPPVTPIPAGEREAVGAYLQRVAALNRDGASLRLRLRWWIVDVPPVLWEGRGATLQSYVGEANEYQRNYAEMTEKVQAFDSITPSAEDANAALLASFEATNAMLDAYRDVIDEYRAREMDNTPRPPRTAREPALSEARTAADHATARAEQLLSVLLDRYRAGSSNG
jgi:hypothetical protein